MTTNEFISRELQNTFFRETISEITLMYHYNMQVFFCQRVYNPVLLGVWIICILVLSPFRVLLTSTSILLVNSSCVTVERNKIELLQSTGHIQLLNQNRMCYFN